MPVAKALAWIEKNHTKISERTYYRICGRLDTELDKRRSKYIFEGIFKKHIDAIDRLEKLISMAFVRVEKCDAAEEHNNATLASNSIARMQEILSSYYDELQDVIEYDADKQNEDPQHYSKESQIQQNVVSFTTEYSGPTNRPTTSN